MTPSTPSPCIVGWSVLSPLGPGRAEFVDGLLAGRVGRLPEAEEDGPAPAGYPVEGFDVARMVGTKGIRTLDRMTLMVIATTTMVLDEHAATLGADRSDVGLVLGTSTGSIASITDFLRDTFVQDKPYFVNPAAFPSTVINGPAGQTAIWHGLRGLNSTVSGGHLTGLAALRYASRMIRRGYADTLLVGSVEELSRPVAWAAGKLRRPPAGTAVAEFAPLGEGCVVFMVDRADVAAEHGRRPLAELVDFEFGVVGAGDGRTAQADRLAEAIGTLLDRAGVSPADLWLVSMAQSGDEALDAAELDAVDRVLGAGGQARRISAAGQVGNTFSALGGFQLAAVLATAERDGPAALDRPSLVTSLGIDGAVACALVRT